MGGGEFFYPPRSAGHAPDRTSYSHPRRQERIAARAALRDVSTLFLNPVYPMSFASTSRRSFLKKASVCAVAPLLLSTKIWSQDKAPSQRLTLGCIGTGKQMGIHLGRLLARDSVQIVAVCDVDTTRREEAKQRIDAAYSAAAGATYKGCTAYNDFRELLARPDIDAVLIATPDHWHAYIAIAAMRAGKDVYCEKPLAYNVHEAVAMMNAVRDTKRVLQTGSQQRSMQEFRVAAELVRNGVLGRVNNIDVHFQDPPVAYNLPAQPLPAGLDWKFWCGPGPLVNYNTELSPRGLPKGYPNWRKTWEFGGGDITDWGAHQIDIAHWALDVDESGPVEMRAPQNWATAMEGGQLVYANGTVLTHKNDVKVRRGISFYGTAGELHVFRGQFELIMGGKTVQRFWTKEQDSATSLERVLALTQREYLANAKIKLAKVSDHFGNFQDCIKSRQRPICDVTIGARTIIACHVMNFGYHYGANVKWDPARNQILSGGDAKWLTRDQYTDGWAV